jgi:hypothetical protein
VNRLRRESGADIDIALSKMAAFGTVIVFSADSLKYEKGKELVEAIISPEIKAEQVPEELESKAVEGLLEIVSQPPVRSVIKKLNNAPKRISSMVRIDDESESSNTSPVESRPLVKVSNAWQTIEVSKRVAKPPTSAEDGKSSGVRIGSTSSFQVLSMDSTTSKKKKKKKGSSPVDSHPLVKVSNP